ncbi:MAG: hypothetical protein IJP62_11760 [Treponema sp.]|nr:hypothetical protein [Treponema sp.]
MKKTGIKTLLVTALVLGLAVTPAIAKSNPWNKGEKNSSHNERMHNRDDENIPGRKGGFMGGAAVVGTVSAISADKQLLTIKDADGNETYVHVNPFTRIESFLPPEEKDVTKAKTKEMPHPNALEFSDVKTGDWVAVRKMETETKVLEARHIVVAKK